jgi:hypothetical protein
MFSHSPRVRQVIYALAVAAQIASFFITLTNAELAVAFVSTATVLTALAGGTALSNIDRSDV